MWCVHVLMDTWCVGLPDKFPGVKEFLEDKVRNDKHGSSMVQDVFKRYLILNCPKSRFVYMFAPLDPTLKQGCEKSGYLKQEPA